MVIICSLLLAMPALSFAEEKKAPGPNATAYKYADEKARFNRNRDSFNSKAHKEIRARKLAERKAKIAKKKEEAAQDKGEGQFKFKF